MSSENAASEHNLGDLVDLSLEDLKESVLRAANASGSFPIARKISLKSKAERMPASAASLIQNLVEDCATLESNCHEYRTALDLVGQELKLMRKRLERSDMAAKEAAKFKTLLKTELLRSTQLEVENARLACQNSELICVMKKALLAPEDSAVCLRETQIELEGLREENLRLRELIAVIADYDNHCTLEGSSPQTQASAPPSILLVTPPRSPEAHRFTVLKSPTSPILTATEELSQPSTPEEELADLGPQATLRIDTAAADEDEPSGSEQVDLTLHDSHALPMVTSPKVASISPMRRSTS